jgi:hypothetical protein
MFQKDFEELAEQLAIVKRNIDYKHVYSDKSKAIADNIWRECVYAVHLACKSTSARYDRGKFMAACGIPNIEMHK